MAKKKGPWTYKITKRKNDGQSIALIFTPVDGGPLRHLFSEWYPPWQNELMKDNAKCMIEDLNKAFRERKKQ